MDTLTRRRLSRRGLHGFTMIELVLVISIIAILSAVALPRFISTQRDARVAKMNAMMGTIRTASALARIRCELDLSSTPVGTCTAVGGTANMDGLAVAMLNKYPAATAAGIQAAANINTATEAMTIAGAGPITFTANGATTPATCVISYTAAAAGAAPTITLNTVGC